MSQTAPSRPAGHSDKQKRTLIVLGLLALGSVFLLPVFVTEPWIVGDVDRDAVAPEVSPTTVSPSKAAEMTRYRQESQVVLAQIIAIRDRLQAQNVDQWAGIEFQQALKKIDTGDQQYNFGEFKAALEDYQQSLSEFSRLEELGQHKLAAALADGLEAIESLNMNVAAASSELASAIAPDDQEVQMLAARLETLPRVTTQLEIGDQASARNELDAAQIAYQNAVKLDHLHRRAAKSLSGVKTEITERIFRQYMSRGFAALENNDFDLAQSAFRQAGGVYPGRPAIAQALALLENRKSQSFVSQQIKRAAELESREQWQQSLSVYESLLEQDPSLTEVKVKLIPVKVRADLDERMKELIDDPLRLSNPSDYRKAQTVMDDARGIPNPGERLRGQIATLDSLLVSAVSFIEVVFQSDNQTSVTLFRVAELGRFEQTSLKLKPGRYVAAGTRKGFRDVRIEFTVTGKQLDDPIVVRCEEPI